MPRKKQPFLAMEHLPNSKAHGLNFLVMRGERLTSKNVFSWRGDKASLEAYAKKVGRELVWYDPGKGKKR
jgi:hypothetical protein